MTWRLAIVLITPLLCIACDSATEPTNFTQAPADNVADAQPQRAKVTIRDSVLLYDGKPTQPELSGNSGLDIVKTFVAADRDLYLIRDTGGTACPATFYVAEVNAAGFRLSSSFGTCSDEAQVSGDAAEIVVSMPGFLGPFEPEEGRIAAAREKHIFRFVNGSVAEAVTRPQVEAAPKLTAAWLTGSWVDHATSGPAESCDTHALAFWANGRFRDGNSEGRFRTDGRSITYFDRKPLDPDEAQPTQDMTLSAKTVNANEMIEDNVHYWRCDDGEP